MTSNELNGLLSLINDADYFNSNKDTPFTITAEQFRDFAIEDLKKDTVHSRVNAIGNVKRAIECRIDQLLYCLCLHVKSEKEKWNFPHKLQILAELGILAPRILHRINHKRNLLEHQYTEPTKDAVEDALDVAVLFIGYTESLCQDSNAICSFGRYQGKNKYEIKIDRKNNNITIADRNGKRNISIDQGDEWITVAKFLLDHDLSPMKT